MSSFDPTFRRLAGLQAELLASLWSEPSPDVSDGNSSNSSRFQIGMGSGGVGVLGSGGKNGQSKPQPVKASPKWPCLKKIRSTFAILSRILRKNRFASFALTGSTRSAARAYVDHGDACWFDLAPFAVLVNQDIEYVDAAPSRRRAMKHTVRPQGHQSSCAGNKTQLTFVN